MLKQKLKGLLKKLFYFFVIKIISFKIKYFFYDLLKEEFPKKKIKLLAQNKEIYKFQKYLEK